MNIYCLQNCTSLKVLCYLHVLGSDQCWRCDQSGTYCCYAGFPWSDWSSGSWWPASWWMPCPADHYCRCIVGSAPPAPRKSPSLAHDDSGPHHATSPSSSPNSFKYIFKISVAIIFSAKTRIEKCFPLKTSSYHHDHFSS